MGIEIGAEKAEAAHGMVQVCGFGQMTTILAGRRRRCGLGLLTLLLAVRATMHGLQLLHLVGGKDARELGMGILLDSARLLAALVGREAGVGAQGGHLLLAVGEDGFKLGCLIIGQAQLLAHVLGCLVCIEGVMATVPSCWLLRGAVLVVGRRRRSLLCERCGRGQGEG